MTYSLTFKIERPGQPTRTQLTTIVGCVDEQAAKDKLRTFYPEGRLQIVKIAPVPAKN